MLFKAPRPCRHQDFDIRYLPALPWHAKFSSFSTHHFPQLRCHLAVQRPSLSLLQSFTNPQRRPQPSMYDALRL